MWLAADGPAAEQDRRDGAPHQDAFPAVDLHPVQNSPPEVLVHAAPPMASQLRHADGGAAAPMDIGDAPLAEPDTSAPASSQAVQVGHPSQSTTTGGYNLRPRKRRLPVERDSSDEGSRGATSRPRRRKRRTR